METNRDARMEYVASDCLASKPPAHPDCIEEGQDLSDLVPLEVAIDQLKRQKKRKPPTLASTMMCSHGFTLVLREQFGRPQPTEPQTRCQDRPKRFAS